MSDTARAGTGRRRLRLAAVLALSGVLLAGCATPGAGSGGAGGPGDAAGGGTATTPAAAPAVTRPAAPTGELPAPLQAGLQAALGGVMTEYAVPGAVAGVWLPGTGSWTTAAGLADVEGGVRATTDMVWPLRSITKSYTVTLLLQLVDEGEVGLDDPVGRYVSGITDGDTITLRELANMSSGMADYTNDDFLADFQKDPSKIYTLSELNSFVLGKPAQFAPGARYVYTNANTNILGAVIEKVTGQPFADVLRQRILDPLGQAGTSYLTDVSEWASPHPEGYVVKDGVPMVQPQNASIFGPAGSLFSTLDDGRVWAETLATGALLAPGTQQQREQGHAIPSPPYDDYALGMGETNGWWGHNGEGIGFTAAGFHDNATGATIVVYMNESDAAGHPADQAFRALAAVLATGGTP